MRPTEAGADAADCPDLGQLEALLEEAPVTGHTAVDEATEGARFHVVSCPTCHRRLEELKENLRLVAPLRAAFPGDGQEAAPERIGRFRILDELGRGGMGVVYLAEQDVPQRRVALKVLRPAHDTREMRRRLEYEADVLARLRHPGIAQVYEAGVADGRFFIAMEIVQGVRLDEHARRNDPGIEERIELLVQTCEAVHHAHLQGVVHRDLKPANVMVEEGGDGPAVKVLDFGVARLVEPDPLLSSLHTESGRLLGTVAYMSPEQVVGPSSAVDARCDVHALGAIGFELLTAHLPYPVEDCSLVEAARRIGCDEPRRAGTLRPELRGDLETVLAKALEKEPRDRYASAAELAADLRRVLRDEPISARPPSATQQVRRFARRHRALVLAAGVVTAALALGFVVAATQAVRARGAEREAQARLVAETAARAEAEAQGRRASERAEELAAVNRFLDELLSAPDPRERPGERDVTVRQVLDEAASGLDAGSLADQPRVEAAVRTTMGRALRSLGDHEEAEAHLQRAVELRRAQGDEADEAALSDSLQHLGSTVMDRGRPREAEALLREARQLRRRTYGPRSGEFGTTSMTLGLLLRELGRHEEARAVLEEGLEAYRSAHGEDSSEVASALNNLAMVAQARGDLEDAEQLYRRSLEMDRAQRGDLHPHIAFTMLNLAQLVSRLGRPDEAEPLTREGVALMRRLYGDEHPYVATSLNNLGVLLRDAGRLDEAEPVLREALDMYGRVHGREHPATANSMTNLGQLFERQGRPEAAEPLFRQALRGRRASLGEEHPLALASLYQTSGALLALDRLDEAETLAAEAVAAGRRTLPEGDWTLGAFLVRLGECLAALGRAEDARAALEEGAGILETTLGSDDPRTIHAAGVLAKL